MVFTVVNEAANGLGRLSRVSANLSMLFQSLAVVDGAHGRYLCTIVR
jgi:hypothetical protein